MNRLHRTALVASVLLAGCAASRDRDLRQVVLVDMPPPPAAKSTAPSVTDSTDSEDKRVAEWGRDDTSDSTVDGGNPFGDAIGDAFGPGGLGSSPGVVGSGGLGGGLGGGANGTARGPRIREGAVAANGRLPPEVIQRIVRQNFGRFRLCYENGLRTNGALSGVLSTQFVIDKDGAISSVSTNAKSTLPDPNVRACIRRAFGGLSFPKPEGGIVTVIYPLHFSPPSP